MTLGAAKNMQIVEHGVRVTMAQSAAMTRTQPQNTGQRRKPAGSYGVHHATSVAKVLVSHIKVSILLPYLFTIILIMS